MSAREPVLVYRIGGLPRVIAGDVPDDHPIRRCSFYVARSHSPAIETAFQNEPEPEPPLDDVERWMGVADVVMYSLERCAQLDVLGESVDGMREYGFHAGEATRFARAIEAAGGEIVDATPQLAALRWFVGPPVVYARIADPAHISIDLLSPVLVPGDGRDPIYALPVSTDQRRTWALDGAGASVEIEPSFVDGSEVRFPYMPTREAQPDPIVLAEACAILHDVFVGTWRSGDPTTTIGAQIIDGVAQVSVTHDYGEGRYLATTRPLAILPVTPFDAVRYRALAVAVRGYLEQRGGELLPEELVPTLLLDDPELVTSADFARALVDEWHKARLVARRSEPAWRACGAHGSMSEAHGFLSITWFQLTPFLMFDAKGLAARQREALAALPEPQRQELVAAARSEYWRWLLSDDVEPELAPIVIRCLEALA